jgi:hypothetical protein
MSDTAQRRRESRMPRHPDAPRAPWSCHRSVDEGRPTQGRLRAWRPTATRGVIPADPPSQEGRSGEDTTDEPHADRRAVLRDSTLTARSTVFPRAGRRHGGVTSWGTEPALGSPRPVAPLDAGTAEGRLPAHSARVPTTSTSPGRRRATRTSRRSVEPPHTSLAHGAEARPTRRGAAGGAGLGKTPGATDAGRGRPSLRHASAWRRNGAEQPPRRQATRSARSSPTPSSRSHGHAASLSLRREHGLTHGPRAGGAGNTVPADTVRTPLIPNAPSPDDGEEQSTDGCCRVEPTRGVGAARVGTQRGVQADTPDDLRMVAPVETRASASARRVGRPRSAPGTGSPGEPRAIPTCKMVVGRHGLRRGARPRGRAGRCRSVNDEGARARSDAGEATAEGNALEGMASVRTWPESVETLGDMETR